MFLLDLFLGGLVAAKPIHSYLKDIVDDFDDNDIWIDGREVVFDMGEYKIRFTYGDFGAQSAIEFKVKNGDVFYLIEGGAAIPGYEIPLVLGIIALSTISLIYLIRKRSVITI